MMLFDSIIEGTKCGSGSMTWRAMSGRSYDTELAKSKDVTEILGTFKVTIDWALTQIVGPAPPSLAETLAAEAAKEAEDARRGVKAAAKADAEAKGKIYQDSSDDEGAAAVDAAAAAGETVPEVAEAEPPEGAELIPKTLQTMVRRCRLTPR